MGAVKIYTSELCMLLTINFSFFFFLLSSGESDGLFLLSHSGYWLWIVPKIIEPWISLFSNIVCEVLNLKRFGKNKFSPVPLSSLMQFCKITEKHKYSIHMSGWQLSGRKLTYKNRMQCLSDFPPLEREIKGPEKQKNIADVLYHDQHLPSRGLWLPELLFCKYPFWKNQVSL